MKNIFRNIVICVLLSLFCISCFPFEGGIFGKNDNVIINDYDINSKEDYNNIILYGERIKHIFEVGAINKKEFDANNSVYITAMDYYKNNKDVSDLLDSLKRTVDRYNYVK